MIIIKKDERWITLNLCGFEFKDAATFGGSIEKGTAIYLSPDIIAEIESFFKYPNGSRNKFPNERLLENVIILISFPGERKIKGYKYNDWLADKTSKNPIFSKNKIYGFLGSTNITLKISLSPKAFL